MATDKRSSPSRFCYFIAGENNPFFGKKHSSETLSRMTDHLALATSAYHRYKEAGGTLKWKAFRHAIKIGEICLQL